MKNDDDKNDDMKIKRKLLEATLTKIFSFKFFVLFSTENISIEKASSLPNFSPASYRNFPKSYVIVAVSVFTVGMRLFRFSLIPLHVFF